MTLFVLPFYGYEIHADATLKVVAIKYFAGDVS